MDKVENWLGSMRALLTEEVERLREESQQAVDRFWQKHYEVRDTKPFSEWGRLGVRVRQRTFSFSIEWYINSFYGPKGNRRVLSKTIKMNRDKSCALHRARDQAKKWELALAMEMEGHFATVRKQLDDLRRIYKLLQVYEKRLTTE